MGGGDSRVEALSSRTSRRPAQTSAPADRSLAPRPGAVPQPGVCLRGLPDAVASRSGRVDYDARHARPTGSTACSRFPGDARGLGTAHRSGRFAALAAATAGRPVADLETVLPGGGTGLTTAATLAWMLKYDLLRPAT